MIYLIFNQKFCLSICWKGYIMTHHDHSHGHHHSHEESGEMPFEEKLKKILDHWIKHNEDHAATYKDWAERTSQAGMNDAARLLKKAADLNITMNEKFEAAKALIGRHE